MGADDGTQGRQGHSSIDSSQDDKDSNNNNSINANVDTSIEGDDAQRNKNNN